jgi:putative colanic acid biosynthesis glycosyltransferase
LDLHRRLRLADIDSHLLYGYASRIADDRNVAGDETIERMGTKPSVLFNYACHRIFGLDVSSGHKELLRAAVASSDIVHVHAPHHHFLRWEYLVGLIREYRKPMVITAHDWWFITGRCGFIEECSGWKRGCGECGKMRFRDPKSLFDFSRLFRRRKVESIAQLKDAVHFVCPSRHLAEDYRLTYPNTTIEVIPNGIDREFESALEQTEGEATTRDGIVFSAADLSSKLKIDFPLVEELAGRNDVHLILVGRNNPFKHPGLEVCGEVRNRQEMVRILRRARVLVFCSRADNSPLTIIEALCAGCFVLAYASPAADEILNRVGGSSVSGREAMIDIVLSGNIESLYGGIDSAELARRSRSMFSGEKIAKAYINTYAEVLRRWN